MATPQSATKKRTYGVWADHVERVYQEVDAHSAQRAHQSARQHPENWQPCFQDEDRNSYRLASDVLDVETQEHFTVGNVEHCRTCHSEIVETVNDSCFGDGECGGCEYLRYRIQPALMDAGQQVVARWSVGDPAGAVNRLREVINTTEHGNHT